MAELTLEELSVKVEKLQSKIEALESISHIQQPEDSLDFSIIDSKTIESTLPYDNNHVCQNCGNKSVNILKITPTHAGGIVYNTITIYCHDCLQESEIEII
jgi:hypothetical protein